jgi:hypothetical protein
MKETEEVISFNYDCLIDETLRRSGAGKWNARYGYGFNLGKLGSNLSSDGSWMRKTPETKEKTIKLYNTASIAN